MLSRRVAAIPVKLLMVLPTRLCRTESVRLLAMSTATFLLTSRSFILARGFSRSSFVSVFCPVRPLKKEPRRPIVEVSLAVSARRRGE